MFHVKHIHALFHVKQNVPAKTGQQTAHPRKQIKTAPSRRNSSAQSPLSGAAPKDSALLGMASAVVFFLSACLGQSHTFFHSFPVSSTGKPFGFLRTVDFPIDFPQNSDIPVHFPKMGFVWGKDERDETGGANCSATPPRLRLP